MTDSAPAHALLSAAHSLLRPAMHHGRDTPAAPTDSLLLIDEAILPADDVTDLRDVVDAINKLCDTMKTSSYDADDEEPAPSIEDELRDARAGDTRPTSYMYNITEERDREADPATRVETEDICEAWAIHQIAELANLNAWPANETVEVNPVSTSRTVEEAHSETWPMNETIDEEINECWASSGRIEEVYCATEQYGSEEWSEPVAQDNLTGQTSEVTSEGEAALNWEAASELYYTASSEVSLVSDLDLPERTMEMDDSVCFSDLTEMPPLSTCVREQEEKSAECVVAGHVAAMRERFESFTRATTPCPEHRASRNVSPSPTQDHNLNLERSYEKY